MDVGWGEFESSWECVALLIGVALVLEGYLGVPCTDTYLANSWLYLHVVVRIWILLLYWQDTSSHVVRHHILYIVRWCAEYLVRSILNHIWSPHAVVEIRKDRSV